MVSVAPQPSQVPVRVRSPVILVLPFTSSLLVVVGTSMATLSVSVVRRTIEPESVHPPPEATPFAEVMDEPFEKTMPFPEPSIFMLPNTVNSSDGEGESRHHILSPP